jgi:hypothetical protein
MYIRRKVYSISALEGDLLEKSFSKGFTEYLKKVAEDVKDYEEVAGDGEVSPAKEAMLKKLQRYIKENPGKSAAIGGGALATIGGGIALAKYLKNRRRKEDAKSEDSKEKNFSEGMNYLERVVESDTLPSSVKESLLKRLSNYVKKNPLKSAGIGAGAAATIGGGIALAKYLKNKKKNEEGAKEEKTFSEYLDDAYILGIEAAQKEFGWLGDKVKGWADKLTNKAAKKDSEGRKQVDSNKGKYGIGAAASSVSGHAKVSAAEGTAAVARGMERAGNKIGKAEDAVKKGAQDLKKKAVDTRDKAVKAGKDFVKNVKDKASARAEQAKQKRAELVKKGKEAFASAKGKVEAAGKKVRNSALEGVANVAGKASKAAGNLEKKALKARRYSEEGDKFEDMKSYRGNGRALLIGDSGAMIARALGNRHATNLAKNNPEISDEELIKKGSKRAAIAGGLLGTVGAAATVLNDPYYREDPALAIAAGSLPIRQALGGYLGAKKAIKDRLDKRDALKLQGQNIDKKK